METYLLSGGQDALGHEIAVSVRHDRIDELNTSDSHTRIVHLAGERILPGLINAHDHLQLNHLPQLEARRSVYVNASEWIAEVNERCESEGPGRAAVAASKSQYAFMGAIKNLLAGVTTVAHHDPLFEPLSDPRYPIRIVERYGWSHSLAIDGATAVKRSHELTPPDRPWIIHAAEGVDQTARREIGALRKLGCLTANTLIVHAVATGALERRWMLEAGVGLIWCPSSNLRLFGRTAKVSELLARNRVALGTDSRLTGSRDMLEELRLAKDAMSLPESTLQALVTSSAAALLRLSDRGHLSPGACADVLVLPPGSSLGQVSRADVRLVIKAGEALYGDADLLDALIPNAWRAIRVDGRDKAMRADLITRLRSISLSEPGLEMNCAIEAA